MDSSADIAVKKDWTVEQLWAAEVSVKKLGKQVTDCSALDWFVRSVERFNTSDGSSELEKHCADRVREFLATMWKAVYPDVIPKRVDRSHGLQRRQLPKRNASRAGSSTAETFELNRATTATCKSTSSSAGGLDSGRPSSPAKHLTPARPPTPSKRKVLNVRNKERSSRRVVSAECLQCYGEQSTVVTAANADDSHTLERAGPGSRSRYDLNDYVPSEPPFTYKHT